MGKWVEERLVLNEQGWSELIEKYKDILVEADRKKIGEFKADIRKRGEFNTYIENFKSLQDLIIFKENYDLHKKYENVEVNIPISVQQIKEKEPFLCQGTIGVISVTFFLACGYWHQLNLTLEEKQKGFFNLMDHFDELMPSSNHIGLVTFQNGIGNSQEDFKKMGQMIVTQLSQNSEGFSGVETLCIGIYNPTEGLRKNMVRVLDKLKTQLSDIGCFTHSFLVTLGEKIKRKAQEKRPTYDRSQAWLINAPQWVHFAHSEGGIIALLALKVIENTQSDEVSGLKDFFQERFLPITYGAVLPIPNDYVKGALNNYSCLDNATLPRVLQHLKELGVEKVKANYDNIKILECEKIPELMEGCYDAKTASLSLKEINQLSYWGERQYHRMSVEAKQNFALVNVLYHWVVRDHSFGDPTYQLALKNNINALKSTPGFYNGL